MVDFGKYKGFDVITLEGFDAATYIKNDKGKLVYFSTSNVNWLNTNSVCVKANEFNFEQFVLNSLNKKFVYDLKPKDIRICGCHFEFWKCEDARGIEYKVNEMGGKFFMLYNIAVKINGQYIEESDMHELFPHFGH